MATDVLTMEKLAALCKNRGFIFAGSEIYGDSRTHGITARSGWS